MAKLAVIKTGGKQYLVKEGDEIKVEKLSVDEKDNFIFDEVLLVASDKGDDVKLGDPNIKSAEVEATITEQGRAKKIRVVKYKNKTRYHKVSGHRQSYSKVKINKIK